MSWYVAKSLNVLRDEINRGAPNRSKASDGSIGDAAHSSRTSDHNPCDCHNAVCARDITHDPGGGFDSYAFADWLRQRCRTGLENRVKYIISNRRIASGTNAWAWRTYSGANPHSQHVHVSVAHGSDIFDSPATWGWAPTEAPPTPTPPPSTVGGTFTLELQKTELTPANQTQTRGNGDVYLVQQIAQGMFKQSGNTDLDCGKPDGDYGPRTQQAVRVMQAICGLAQDAECGPQTWSCILNKDGQ